jgi:hypothetical protein
MLKLWRRTAKEKVYKTQDKKEGIGYGTRCSIPGYLFSFFSLVAMAIAVPWPNDHDSEEKRAPLLIDVSKHAQ